MKTRDFFVAMPKLCKAKNAERWAEQIGHAYDVELAGGSAFDKNEADAVDPDNRMECAFAFLADNEGAKEQCKRLARCIMFSHELDEHGDKSMGPLIEANYNAAKAVEADYPDISALMTADDAVAGHWAD